MNRISNSALFFFANKFKILQPSMCSEWIESYCSAGLLEMEEVKVVFLTHCAFIVSRDAPLLLNTKDKSS